LLPVFYPLRESQEAAHAILGVEELRNSNFLYRKIGRSENINRRTRALYLLLGGGKNESKGFTAFLKATNKGDVLVLSTKADAIVFTGGNQARYINRIKGTKAYRALLKKIKLGTLIAGTSAGLAVMGEYIFSAKEGGLSSSYALKNPHAKEITIEENFPEIELLSALITDTHFMNRNREGRLLSFMFRTQFDYKFKSLFGIGIDEQSSLVITKKGMRANGGVHIYKKLLGLIPVRQYGNLTHKNVLKKTLEVNKGYPHFSKVKFSKSIEVRVGEIKKLISHRREFSKR
jgi:cyanophycinase